jgi:mRNA interferase MazF
VVSAAHSARHSSQHSSKQSPQQGSPKRDQVWLVTLDPTHGSEIQKTRPCLVVSPDEMNQHLRTVIVAPMTTVTRPYPTRVGVRFQGKQGQVALDQLRSVDRQRLVRRLGKVSGETAQDVSATLLEMFSRI